MVKARGGMRNSPSCWELQIQQKNATTYLHSLHFRLSLRGCKTHPHIMAFSLLPWMLSLTLEMPTATIWLAFQLQQRSCKRDFAKLHRWKCCIKIFICVITPSNRCYTPQTWLYKSDEGNVKPVRAVFPPTTHQLQLKPNTISCTAPIQHSIFL